MGFHTNDNENFSQRIERIQLICHSERSREISTTNLQLATFNL